MNSREVDGEENLRESEGHSRGMHCKTDFLRRSCDSIETKQQGGGLGADSNTESLVRCS
jgi:hypothetical protein